MTTAWVESNMELGPGVAWPAGIPTHDSIAAARTASPYDAPEKTYLYAISAGRVLGRCQLYVTYSQSTDSYTVLTSHNTRHPGTSFLFRSIVQSGAYDTCLELCVLSHIERAALYTQEGLEI